MSFGKKRSGRDGNQRSFAKNGGRKSAVSVKRSDDGTFLIRLPSLSEEQRRNYKDALAKEFGEVSEKAILRLGRLSVPNSKINPSGPWRS